MWSLRLNFRNLRELAPAHDVTLEQRRHGSAVALERIHAELQERFLGVLGGIDLPVPGGKFVDDRLGGPAGTTKPIQGLMS